MLTTNLNNVSLSESSYTNSGNLTEANSGTFNTNTCSNNVHLNTEDREETDTHWIKRFLLPVKTKDLKVTLRENLEEDNAQLFIYIDPEDLEDNPWVDTVNFSLSIHKRCFNWKDVEVNHKDNVLEVKLTRSDNQVPTEVKVSAE